jgi:dynein heavy chain
MLQAWLCNVEMCDVLQAWLCDVEKTMRWTLKEVLKNTRQALKKSLTKRDKWIKEWPGQVRWD